MDLFTVMQARECVRICNRDYAIRKAIIDVNVFMEDGTNKVPKSITNMQVSKDGTNSIIIVLLCDDAGQQMPVMIIQGNVMAFI